MLSLCSDCEQLLWEEYLCFCSSSMFLRILTVTSCPLLQQMVFLQSWMSGCLVQATMWLCGLQAHQQAEYPLSRDKDRYTKSCLSTVVAWVSYPQCFCSFTFHFLCNWTLYNHLCGFYTAKGSSNTKMGRVSYIQWWMYKFCHGCGSLQNIPTAWKHWKHRKRNFRVFASHCPAVSNENHNKE